MATAYMRQHTGDGQKCLLRIHHPTQSDASATSNALARGIMFQDSAAAAASVLQVIPNTVGSAVEASAPIMEFYIGGDGNAFKWMTITSKGNVNILGAASTTTITNALTVNGNTVLGDAKATDTFDVNAISTISGVTTIQNTFYVKNQV